MRVDREGKVLVISQGQRPIRVGGIRALIWPKSKMIAGPVLQVKYGGSKRIPQLFDLQFWTVSPLELEKPVMVTMDEHEWMALAARWSHERA
jgi:hypothetical protein